MFLGFQTTLLAHKCWLIALTKLLRCVSFLKTLGNGAGLAVHRNHSSVSNAERSQVLACLSTHETKLTWEFIASVNLSTQLACLLIIHYYTVCPYTLALPLTVFTTDTERK